jgi:predicted patatin/cPLA2 family phospholipase
MRKRVLILQGGGFRTSFTAGVLDAFSSHDYNPFDKYVAVSGGSIALSYYLSNQYKNYYKTMCFLAEDKKFMSYNRMISPKGIMNVDYFRTIASEKFPFDTYAALEAIVNKEIAIVITDRENGSAHYHRPCEDSWIDAIIASCTIPFVTKGKHEINGIDYMDGGWSDPLPVQWAVENGATDIVVVRTSPATLKMTQSWPDYFGSFVFRSNDKLKACFERNHEIYNASIDFMNNPPNGVNIIQIAPDGPLQTGTYSNSVKLITSDYRCGMENGLNFIQSLKGSD